MQENSSEISIVYNSRLVKAAELADTVLAPAAICFSVMLLLAAWMATYVNPAAVPVIAAALKVFGLQGMGAAARFAASLAFLIAYMACTFWALANPLSKKRLFVFTPDRIHFPRVFSGPLRFRTHRQWSDVKSVVLDAKQHLRIRFKSGGAVDIDLALLPKEEIERMLLTMEAHCPAVRDQAEVLSLLNNLHDERMDLGKLSYTKLWEDELNRRFSSTTFTPLEAGQSLRGGDLEIIKQLAFGGFSAVYLAQRGSDRVVVKESVINSINPVLHEKASAMMDKEFEILKRLSHPYIAEVLDLFEEQGRHYLVLRYIAGENLRQVVMQLGPQPELRCIGWATQAANLLGILHDHQPEIIHRDLTPDNLVLDSDGNVHLVDFGAANFIVGTATGTLIGKQSYIAPEQFRGKATAQSDIYSLGCTLYYLLTGEDPEPLTQSSPREKNAHLTQAIDDLVRACTSLECKGRLLSWRQVIERLNDLAAQPAEAIT